MDYYEAQKARFQKMLNDVGNFLPDCILKDTNFVNKICGFMHMCIRNSSHIVKVMFLNNVLKIDLNFLIFQMFSFYILLF